jgi:hypothetical protein
MDELIVAHRTLVNDVLKRRGDVQEDITLILLALEALGVRAPIQCISHGIGTLHGWVVAYWRHLSNDCQRGNFLTTLNAKIAGIVAMQVIEKEKLENEQQKLAIKCEKELLQMAELADRYRLNVRLVTISENPNVYPKDDLHKTDTIDVVLTGPNLFGIRLTSMAAISLLSKGSLVCRDQFGYPLVDMARISTTSAIILPRLLLRQINWEEEKARTFQIAQYVSHIQGGVRLPKSIVELILGYHNKLVKKYADNKYYYHGADYYPRYNSDHIQPIVKSLDDFAEFEERKPPPVSVRYPTAKADRKINKNSIRVVRRRGLRRPGALFRAGPNQ